MSYDSDNDSVQWLWILPILLILLLIGWGTSWFGLVVDRDQQKYREETRGQVYDTSRQAQEGMSRDILRYCDEMRDTTRPSSSRKAVANLIKSQADTFQGKLVPEADKCVDEAKDM